MLATVLFTMPFGFIYLIFKKQVIYYLFLNEELLFYTRSQCIRFISLFPREV